MVTLVPSLRKYFSLITVHFTRQVEYRTELAIWLLLDTVPTLVLIAVWSVIYAGQNSLRGVEFGQVIQYYLLVGLVTNISQTHFERQRVQQIRDGRIDYFLIRPLPYLLEVLCGVVGSKIMFTLLTLPFFAGMWWLLGRSLPITSLSADPQIWLMGGILLFTSLIFNFLLSLIIVLLGFWFEGSDGLEHFKWAVSALLGSTIAPLPLLPSWLQTVIMALPFKYLFTVPVSVWQGTYQATVADGVYLTSTLAVTTLFVMWLWRAAIRQYSSAGG